MKKALTISLVFGIATPTALQANEAHYDIDWRGLSIGEVTFFLDGGAFQDSERSYKVSYEVRSTGMLSLMFPFESRGYSSGLIQKGDVVATTHSAISTVRGEPRSWTVGFDLDGSLSHLDVQEDGERELVPDQLKRAPDPLALALTALREAQPGAQIEGQSFDGRRAVKLGMECAEQDTAAGASDQNLLNCSIEGELLAGASKRWQDDHDDDEPVRKPVEITLARNVMSDGWSDTWWPIALQVESKYGPVTATLVKREID